MPESWSDATTSNDIPNSFLIEDVCDEFEKNWDLQAIDRIMEIALPFGPSLSTRLVVELVAVDCELRSTCNDPSEIISRGDYALRLANLPQKTAIALQNWIDNRDPNEFVFEQEQISIPERIGDYRILGIVGRGGGGVVYEAIQESLGRPVAIKMLPNIHVTSQINRFRQEAKAIALLHHTNIVEVYGSGSHEGHPYFAMQLIDGQSLSEILDASIAVRRDSGFTDFSGSELVGPENQRSVATIGLQVARALQHAHQRGVLHRDIKPSNLLVDRAGAVWVSDFGLAKLNDQESDNTLTGHIVGTLRYIPPEAFHGKRDCRSDIYSLGITLYELLTMERVFSETENVKLIKQVTHRETLIAREFVRSIGQFRKTSKRSSPKPCHSNRVRVLRQPASWPTNSIGFSTESPSNHVAWENSKVRGVGPNAIQPPPLSLR